jgi:AcrR family transcriptional regulator
VTTGPATSVRTANKWGEGARLREEILAAATRLLERTTSREAVSLRAIARETGIAPPSIYQHFHDRDAILDAVVSSTYERLDAVCSEAVHQVNTGAERVQAISRAYVAFATEHRSEYRILFERSPATLFRLDTDPHPYPAGMHAFQHFIDAFEQMVTEGSSASTDPIGDAQALWAALHGAITLIPATPGFPWKPTPDIIDHLIERLTRYG